MTRTGNTLSSIEVPSITAVLSYLMRLLSERLLVFNIVWGITWPGFIVMGGSILLVIFFVRDNSWLVVPATYILTINDYFPSLMVSSHHYICIGIFGRNLQYGTLLTVGKFSQIMNLKVAYWAGLLAGGLIWYSWCKGHIPLTD